MEVIGKKIDNEKIKWSKVSNQKRLTVSYFLANEVIEDMAL
jgi:hypothetical protein